jgi:hypothetical protein
MLLSESRLTNIEKNCLWRGSDESNKVNAKLAWTLVTKPKTEGGLGVLNLKTQNEALLVKTCTSSSADQIFPGSTSYGRNIIATGSYQTI